MVLDRHESVRGEVGDAEGDDETAHEEPVFGVQAREVGRFRVEVIVASEQMLEAGL